MKRLKRLYTLPALIAIGAAILLIGFLFPSAFYVRAALLAFVPLAILALGFRIITRQRIQIIRKQLYQILHILEKFDVDEPQNVEFEESAFPLFNELNEYLVELIDRIRDNYRANKQFTQNASHELQTPLAVIKGNVELLLQSPNMGEKEMEALSVVLQNARRLSKINKALILLSKIEHQRFADTETVKLNQIMDEVLGNFRDLIQIHNLEIRKEYRAVFELEMSAALAEILVANLMQNAIRHNIEEGFVEIIIETDRFSIRNPGRILKAPPETLFKRFQRESEAEESLGLGLSIVRRICERSDLEVLYVYEEELHTLVVSRSASLISAI